MTREETMEHYWKQAKLMHEVGYEQYISKREVNTKKMFDYVGQD